MGSINVFNLKEIKEKTGINLFIETGTLHGDGVDYALNQGFEKIISIEINEQLASIATNKYKNNKNIQIICGNSSDVLEQILPSLTEPALFWLDAHFPGVDARLSTPKSEKDKKKNIPLEWELSIIKEHAITPFIICDDLWIYEDWVTNTGTLNEHCKNHNIDITREYLDVDGALERMEMMFNITHNLKKVYQDQGYLVFMPKK